MSRSHLILALMLSIAGFSGTLPAEIIEIAKFEEVGKYIAPDTFIIFDIDNTLIEPVQTLGSDQWFYRQLQFYQSNGMTRKNALDKALAEWTAIQNLTKVQLIESSIKPFLDRLQQEGFTVIGLTTRGLGLAHRTVEQLHSVGIDLFKQAPSRDEIFFMNDGEGVLYRQGVLFTAATDKGTALLKLLKEIKITPKRILFVNDKASHLEPVQKMAKSENIPFIGLRYGFLDKKVQNFPKEIADLEFAAFGYLMPDSEAEFILREEAAFQCLQ